MHASDSISVGSTTSWPFKINRVVPFSLDNLVTTTLQKSCFFSLLLLVGTFLPPVLRLRDCVRHFCHKTPQPLNGKICKICKITCSENRRTTRRAPKGLTAAETSMGILLVRCVMVKVTQTGGQNGPNLCQVTQQRWTGACCPPTAPSLLSVS